MPPYAKKLTDYYKDSIGNWDLGKWDDLKMALEQADLPHKTKVARIPFDDVEHFATLALICISIIDWAEANGEEHLADRGIADEKQLIYLLIVSQISQCRSFLQSKLMGWPNVPEQLDLIFGDVCQYWDILQEMPRLSPDHISSAIH